MPSSTRPIATGRPRHPAAVRSTAGLAPYAALLLIAAALVGPVRAGVLHVTLTVPTPEVLDMSGIHKILVTRFVIDQEVPDFDLNREMVNGLRRDLRRRTNLEILDVEPPPSRTSCGRSTTGTPSSRAR